MRIFLSISNGYREDQINFENQLCKFLENNGHYYKTVSCLCNKGESPIEQIIAEIKKCDAVISLAFDRKHVYLEYHKELNLIQRLESHDKYYTSPWVHIECAIAKALNKPLLIFVPQYVYEEGVLDFSQDWYNIRYMTHSANTDTAKYEINSFETMNSAKQTILEFLSNI